MYDNMIKEMHLFRRRGLSNATNIARSLEEHRAISDAIIAGDTDAARRAGEQHTTSGFTRYLSQADKADTSAAD